MKSGAATVAEYLASLPPGTRKEIEAVRRVVRDHLPAGYEETMDFGMIVYVVPLPTYPDTYNGHPLPIAGLAAQKRHNALYLMGVYGDPATRAWFERAYAASGKKLDMGKSCLRFRRAEELALDVVGRTIARIPAKRFVAMARAARTPTRGARSRRAS